MMLASRKIRTLWFTECPRIGNFYDSLDDVAFTDEAGQRRNLPCRLRVPYLCTSLAVSALAPSEVNAATSYPSAINDPLTAGMPLDSISAKLLQRICCGLKVRAALSSEVVCGHVRSVNENGNANEIPLIFQPWVRQHKALWACISPQPQVLASYFADC